MRRVFASLLATTLAFLVFGNAPALFGIAGEAQAAPVQRYQTDIKGDIAVFGNTLARDCGNSPPAPVVGTVGNCGGNTGDTGIDIFWRSDSPAAGQAEANNGITVANARSKAVFQLPAGATVEYARLYWAAKAPAAAADTSVTFTAPDGTALAVTADQSWTSAYSGDTFYQATALVTNFLKTEGTGGYTLSGVNVMDVIGNDDETAFAGWCMRWIRNRLAT